MNASASVNRRWLTIVVLIAGIVCTIAGIAVYSLPAQAQDETPDPVTAQDDELDAPTADEVAEMARSGGESYCMICHNATTEQTFELADGSERSIAVDMDILSHSAHGADNPDGALACSDCHQGVQFPHSSIQAQNDRAYTVSRALGCVDCHEEHAENLADGVHYTALVAGNLRSATCVDCHGGHDVQTIDEDGGAIAMAAAVESCGDCHVDTFSQYRDSVHGEALFAGDQNVPACTDCHGVHGIQHPTTALFRNRSPELCATCHADADLMEEYDISTNVFDSYLSDFHGTTVSLFDQPSPDVPTNKAVCYDCHGVHDITAADDEKSQVVQENLLATCQQCHPGATANFPATWVGHFEPTAESHPLLFAMRIFYDILIPFTLGGFVLLISTDVFRRVRRRLSGRS